MAPPQFQAFILCGPGMSLNTFTSNPATFPKALIPIANRPMIWYPLQWCYRAGISDVTLITPFESQTAIQAALSQNPYLTSLSSGKPTVISPKGLTFTTSTADIFRLPEVQAAITTDFMVLPCDFVSEIECISFLDSWALQQASVGGVSPPKGLESLVAGDGPKPTWPGGEQLGRRGGMSMYYNTASAEGKKVKGAETDFVISAPIESKSVPFSRTNLMRRTERLILTMPTDTLGDVFEDEGEVQVRIAAMKKHPKSKVRALYRDSHFYMFPFWVKEMIAENDELECLGEDIIGWWAKASWQEGTANELGLPGILAPPEQTDSNELLYNIAQTTSTRQSTKWTDPKAQPVAAKDVPPILSYFHIQGPKEPFVGRADTVPLLLSTSLRLASLPPASTAPAGTTPVSATFQGPTLAHPSKIMHPDRVPRQCRIEQENSLLGANVTVGDFVNIKECVIGANCEIGAGARLVRCVLMDGVKVGENVTVSGSVIGFRAHLEGGARKSADRTDLRDCEVQEDMIVPWGTDAKNEKFVISNIHNDLGSSDGSDA